jgi:hypothetical protein
VASSRVYMVDYNRTMGSEEVDVSIETVEKDGLSLLPVG